MPILTVRSKNSPLFSLGTAVWAASRIVMDVVPVLCPCRQGCSSALPVPQLDFKSSIFSGKVYSVSLLCTT